MTYSHIGIIALLVQLITNYDVFQKGTDNDLIPAHKSYRRFLLSVMLYYIADILWGILDTYHLIALLYADTVIYYVAMALSVLLWTHYVMDYLNENSKFSKGLYWAGRVFFVFEILLIIINFFKPIMFFFNEVGIYQAQFARHFTFIIQIILFFLSSVYTLILGRKTGGRKRLRYRTIGIFGMEMIVMISIQVYFPLLPLYSIGCMLGTCLLHTFVLEDEKAEYRKKLEEMIQRDQEQKQALGSAKHLAYTDPLTGVKSKRAYLEAIERIDSGIADGSITEFGVIVFDLNGLKEINDTLGHEEGDKYIKSGCMVVCRTFCHSPIYRIGGDEFVALLEGQDYADRNLLLLDFDRQMENNLLSGSVVVSTGIDVFSVEQDNSYSSVFERADKKMYDRKRFLKAARTLKNGSDNT